MSWRALLQRMRILSPEPKRPSKEAELQRLRNEVTVSVASAKQQLATHRSQQLARSMDDSARALRGHH